MTFDLEKAMADIIARHYAEFPKEPTGATGPTTDAGKLDEARSLPKNRQNANPGKQMPAAA